MAVKPDIARTSRDWSRRAPFITQAFANDSTEALTFLDPAEDTVTRVALTEAVDDDRLHALILIHIPAIVRILGEIAGGRGKRDPAALLFPVVPAEIAPALVPLASTDLTAVDFPDIVAAAFAQAVAEEIADDGVDVCVAPVAPDSPVRSDAYHVAFATRSADAVVRMNDALIRERLEGGHQIAIDFGTEALAATWEDFRDVFFSIASDFPQTAWKQIDLVAESVRRRFAERRSAEHRRAIAQLLARTYGDRLRPVGGLRRGGAWQIQEWTRLEFVTAETETVNVDAVEEDVPG